MKQVGSTGRIEFLRAKIIASLRFSKKSTILLPLVQDSKPNALLFDVPAFPFPRTSRLKQPLVIIAE